jgi:Bacterial Ig-like domain (group 3)
MCAEVARGFEPPLNGGNPRRQVRTGRRVIVLLAAVGLLGVLSPLVVAASSASAAVPNPIITVTTTWTDGAMGGEPIGFVASGFPPNSTFAWQVIDDNTLDGYPCAGTLATDASGDASIDDACSITFGPPNQSVTVIYDGVTETVAQPPAQPPAPPTPTVTTPTVSPSTTNVGGSVTYSVEVATPSAPGNPTPSGTVAFTDGSVPLCTTAPLGPDVDGGAAVGQCNASNAPVGTDTITATYTGVTGMFFSTEGSVGTTTLTVNALSLGPMSHRPPSPRSAAAVPVRLTAVHGTPQWQTPPRLRLDRREAGPSSS